MEDYPPADWSWETQQIYEANHLLRWLLFFNVQPRLEALQGQVGKDIQSEFNDYQEAIGILLAWSPYTSYPLALVIELVRDIYEFILNEFTPPIKPNPLPDGRVSWKQVVPWMVWYHHRRNPEKGLWEKKDEALGLAMNRTPATVKKYRKRYRAELEDLEFKRQADLARLRKEFPNSLHP